MIIYHSKYFDRSFSCSYSYLNNPKCQETENYMICVFDRCGWKKLGTDDCTIFYNPHEELQNTLADVAKKSATFCKSLYSKIRYHLPRMNCYKPTEEKEKEE